MQTPYNIILVDDHEMVRSAFRVMLENAVPCKVIEEFATGADFIRSQPNSSSADLLILDLSMPVMDGQQVIGWMKENDVQIKTLVVTMETNDEWIAHLFRSGIRGYLRKQSPSSELKRAIEDIMSFGYFHNDIFNTFIMAPESSVKSERDKILGKITDKELQFLKLVCHEEEYTYEQMTSILNVHRRTLDNYRESLFEKFSIKSKSGLVLFALKHKLI
jgi:two-component system invasion response regulator UvrY